MSNEQSTQQSNSSLSHKIGNTADVIIGDFLLGGLGRVGFHSQMIPGLGKIGTYVRENISEGYHKAQASARISVAVKNCRKVQDEHRVTLTSGQIREFAVEAGCREEDMDKVRELAEKNQPAGVDSRSVEAPLPIPG